jgi:hypothetical protein
MSDYVYVIFKAGPESYQNEAETCFNFVYPRHIHRRMHGYIMLLIMYHRSKEVKLK